MNKDANVKEKITGGAPKKKKKWIVVLIVVLILAAIIIFAVKNAAGQVELSVNTVEIEPVVTRDLSDSISIKGTIAGDSKTNVTSKASAEVKAVNVQVGDVVNAGDALVSLDTEEIQKQIAETNKNLTNASALAKNDATQKSESLAEAQADQENALKKAQKVIDDAQENYNELVKKRDECQAKLDEKDKALAKATEKVDSLSRRLETASDAELAELQTEYASTAQERAEISAQTQSLTAERNSYNESIKAAEEQIEAAKVSYEDTLTATNRSVSAAENTVNMSKYQSADSTDLEEVLENLEKQLEDCELTAPCGGVVTAVNISVGDNYVAGTVMITIEDTSKMKVVVSVEEADILKIEEGMKAVITADATGDEEISGTVSRVVRVKNQSVNTMNSMDTNTATGYSAEISIDNTELLIGMSAKAKIILQDKGNILAVPYDLIQYDENGDAYVLCAENNSDGTATAVRKNIVVGDEVNYYTEITGGDLVEGDLLIYDYSYSMTEGQIFTPEQMYSNQELEMDSNAVVEAE